LAGADRFESAASETVSAAAARASTQDREKNGRRQPGAVVMALLGNQ